MLGLSEQAITQAITAATSGWDISYLHSEQQKYALPIRLRLGQQSRDQHHHRQAERCQAEAKIKEQ